MAVVSVFARLINVKLRLLPGAATLSGTSYVASAPRLRVLPAADHREDDHGLHLATAPPTE
jgi:hypothetical protein